MADPPLTGALEPLNMGAVMRRIENPPNPFERAHLEWDGPPPPAQLEVFEQQAKTALSRNESPDLGFSYSLNPYRGCFHACAYCYARPSHEYLGFGAGTDFDRRVVVKTNIAELLRASFEKKSWRGELVAFSGNTDCYQPLEASYELTRACLTICAEYRNPVAMITKGTLIRRDIDLLARLARQARASVGISVAFVDDSMARAIEPFASSPSKRFETIRQLTEAGVPTNAILGPVILGLNDDQVPEILQRAAAAGADGASLLPLRLSPVVRGIFEARLAEAFPLRAKKVANAYAEAGADPRGFHQRMHGRGARWAVVEQLFERSCARLGLTRSTPEGEPEEPSTFRRPRAQLELFG